MTARNGCTGFELPDSSQIESVLSFARIFRDPSFEPVVRMSGGKGGEEYPIWADEVRDFYRALHSAGFVLDRDTPRWHREAVSCIEDPGLLRDADLATLCRVFTAHVQREMSDEGHFPRMVQSGHMSALLERLRQLLR